MLIVKLFRLSQRTFRSLTGKRKTVSQTGDAADAMVYARTGLFATPAAVGLLTGVISAAIHLLPSVVFSWNYSNMPVPIACFVFMSLGTLCSGPFLLTLSARNFFSLARFTFLLALVGMVPLFLVFQMRVYALYRIFYSINVVFGVGASWLIGRHLARNYGALRSLTRCGLLGVVGNLPMIGFECYQVWKWDVLGQREQMSKDMLAFFVMAFLISQIGVATLPALASEREFRERVNASNETLIAAQR